MEAGSLAVLPSVIVRTLRLVFGVQLLTGTATLLAVYSMLQRLVETNMPKKLTIKMEPTYISWKVVKTTVQ